MCLFNKTIQVHKTDEFKIKTITYEPKSFVLHEVAASSTLFLTLLSQYLVTERQSKMFEMENQEEKRVLQMVDNILRYPTMKRF